VIVLDCDQRSPEWFTARLGKLTSSRASDMLAQIKSGEAAARRDLRMLLVCERLTQRSQESGFVSADMQRGVEMEPLAVVRYELEAGQMVRPVGFIGHDSLMAGYSPDGLVGDDGLIEVKCPKSATHLSYLRSRKVPTDYLRQIQHALWITGRAWCDFISFDDRFPAPLDYLCIRVTRDDKEQAAYELAAQLFLSEVATEVEAVQALAGVAA
jgi:predicted phage-related endonuclease